MFIWVEEEAIIAAHELLVAQHGGVAGIRDLTLLQSALARAANLVNYGEADLATCAATYAFGIVRNHPFADGNKRTAFVTMDLFLVLNGFELTVDDADAVERIVSLAAGEIDETAYADWIRSNLKPGQ